MKCYVVSHQLRCDSFGYVVLCSVTPAEVLQKSSQKEHSQSYGTSQVCEIRGSTESSGKQKGAPGHAAARMPGPEGQKRWSGPAAKGKFLPIF